MNDITYNSYIRNLTNPVSPVTNNPNTSTNTVSNENGISFADVLTNTIQANSNIEFSKHAMNRVVERNIDLSVDKIERLNKGVELANDKGLNDTLIIIDQLAFVVNVKNNKVITTVNEDALKGNVFTNIDGTVII